MQFSAYNYRRSVMPQKAVHSQGLNAGVSSLWCVAPVLGV